MTKIGIFGGAFNPIHKGHVNMAIEAAKELKLQKLLVIPTGVSPHKKSASVSFEDRAEMCRIAFSDFDKAEICDIEKNTNGKNYTIETIRKLREIYHDAQFFLIIGGDMLLSFKTWYRYESVLKEAKVVAIARHTNEYVDLLEYSFEISRVKVLNIPVIEASSSEIREKLSKGEDASDLLPDGVLEYIKEKSLYI